MVRFHDIEFTATEDEFLALWSKRYVYADGSARSDVHIGTFASALRIVKDGNADALAVHR